MSPYNVRDFDFKYILITSMGTIGKISIMANKNAGQQPRFESVASYFPQQFLQVDKFTPANVIVI